MVRRVLLFGFVFLLVYVVSIQFQVEKRRVVLQQKEEKPAAEEEAHKVYFFSFTKYTPEGSKEIEIEGDSADILANTVHLLNVVAKAYADEVPVTITADRGQYHKSLNKVHIEENVVATTEDGTRLMTEELDIHPEEHRLENEVKTVVKKDNINIDGIGTRGDTRLKKVEFKKNVTVVVQQDAASDPTVITCDGPLEIDYRKNIAHFSDNVVAKDSRGILRSQQMDVYYNRLTSRVAKIVATGNVVIENPDGNKTYSDNVIYLADEGRVILGGDIEALYTGESNFSKQSEGGWF